MLSRLKHASKPQIVGVSLTVWHTQHRDMNFPGEKKEQDTRRTIVGKRKVREQGTKQESIHRRL
jgi:hypothetical protein